MPASPFLGVSSPTKCALVIACLIGISSGAVVLDGTGLGTGVIQILYGPTPYGVTSGFTGTRNTAGGGTVLHSASRYGFSLRTTQTYTLFRLDVALNAGTGSPYVVDFLVEVWNATGPLAIGLAPLFSAHAVGTVPARGVQGFASLVLPGFFVLAGGGTYAVTVSPQTPSTLGFTGWGFPRPVGGQGVTVLSDCYQSGAGATWVSLGSSNYFGIRLLDAAVVTNSQNNVWTDQTSGGNVVCGYSCLSGLSLAPIVASSTLFIGLTVPNDGSQSVFGISRVSFSVCAGTGAVPGNSLFFSLALYAATVNGGLVSPQRVLASVPVTLVPPITGRGSATVSVSMPDAAWALAYTPATPFVFIGANFSGTTTNAYLCSWTDSTHLYWRSDAWSITGVGALSYGSSWSPADFYENGYANGGYGKPPLLNGIKVTGNIFTTSQTASQSASLTQTQSVTQTRSVTSAPTQSQSLSPTITKTKTMSGSQEASPSQSVTSSQSGSSSPTSTPSQSVTTGQTPTITATQAPTASGTPSLTRTQTKTLTLTPSASRSGSPSCSSTSSMSETVSVSTSQSISSSRSGSPSESPSRSGALPSASITGSESSSKSTSPSASQTTSGTTSGTRSPVASTTDSANPTVTVTDTQSLSGSPSSSVTFSVSLTRMASESPMQTSTGSGRPSDSTSRSRIASVSRSQDARLSRSQALSSSASHTQQETTSQAPSVGLSWSGTPTQTPTSTPIPYELAFTGSQGGDESAGTSALILSDSLPPGLLTLGLNRCPDVAAQRDVSLNCVVRAEYKVGTVESAAAAAVLISVRPSPSERLLCISGERGVPLPFYVSLLPPFETNGMCGVISCTLTGSDGAEMGTAALNLTVYATLWPRYDDVIVISNNAFSRSVTGLGPGVINMTSALLLALEAAEAPASDAPRNIEAALSRPGVMFDAVRLVWNEVDLQDTAQPFSLTLSGSSPLVLRSRSRSFVRNTTVRIGSLPCNDTLVSEDGAWLFTVAPPPSLICAAGGSCDYTSLSVQNPLNCVVGASGSSRGATLVCPPFCASSIDGNRVFPLAEATLKDGAHSFVPAVIVSDVAVPLDLATAPSSVIVLSSGLFYSEACSATGIYTDPSSGVCTNSSDPRSALCAFGGSAACKPCPAGAVCPGGFRAWPHRGYWSPAESSDAVTPCINPDAPKKCLGWNAALSASQCGIGYQQGSFLCGACAAGFYLSGDGTCDMCPVSPSLWVQYSGLFTLIAIVVGFVLVVYTALYSAILCAGRSTSKVVRHVMTLLVHCLTILQVVSNVAQVGSKRLPVALRFLYEGVALLQLQGITLPPSCTHGYLFSTEVALLGVAAGIWLLAAALVPARRNLLGRCWRPTVGGLVYLAVYLHPSVTSTALGLLNCRTVLLSSTAAAALEEGSSSPSPQTYSATAAVSYVSVLSRNPFVPCFGRLHSPAGGVAAAVLFSYVAAMPMCTFWWLWRDPWLKSWLSGQTVEQQRASSRLGSSNQSSALGKAEYCDGGATATDGESQRFDKDPILSPFLSHSGYVYRAWYWRHVDLAVICGLSSINALIPIPFSATQVFVKLGVSLILLSALAALLVFSQNPYREPWKRSVRLALVALSAACAAINAASRALDLGLGGAALASTISPGAYCILGIFCVTGAVLLVGFGRDMLRNASRLVAADTPLTTSSASPEAPQEDAQVDNSADFSSSDRLEDAAVLRLRSRDTERTPVVSAISRPSLLLSSLGISAASPDIGVETPDQSFEVAQDYNVRCEDVRTVSLGATPGSLDSPRAVSQGENRAGLPIDQSSGIAVHNANVGQGSAGCRGSRRRQDSADSLSIDVAPPGSVCRSVPHPVDGMLLAFPPVGTPDVQQSTTSEFRAPSSYPSSVVQALRGRVSKRQGIAGPVDASRSRDVDSDSVLCFPVVVGGEPLHSEISQLWTSSPGAVAPEASRVDRRSSLQAPKVVSTSAFAGRTAIAGGDTLSVKLSSAGGKRKCRASFPVVLRPTSGVGSGSLDYSQLESECRLHFATGLIGDVSAATAAESSPGRRTIAPRDRLRDSVAAAGTMGRRISSPVSTPLSASPATTLAGEATSVSPARRRSSLAAAGASMQYAR